MGAHVTWAVRLILIPLFVVCPAANSPAQQPAARQEGPCIAADHGLRQLASDLSPRSAISCKGQPLQQVNAHRYWGQQYGKNAAVVIFPTSTLEVAAAVVASHSSSKADHSSGGSFAFVSGAHGQTSASSSDNGFLIDLSWMNSTQLLHDITIDDTHISNAIRYQGGATWGTVQMATKGTRWTAIGARVGSVGVGGFSTGGGIGYLAGAYGYAVDRLRAMEVVLPSGEIVITTKTNKYSDLFWALQGGNGQFGLVTTFYQEAVPEPSGAIMVIFTVSSESYAQAEANTVDWFKNNQDPFAVMYWAFGTSDTIPGSHMFFICIYLDNPHSPKKAGFDRAFKPLIKELKMIDNITLDHPYERLLKETQAFFPYGHRRGFYGPQTTEISTTLLAKMRTAVAEYIEEITKAGDDPKTSLYMVQFMYPGLNGNLPKSDADTAWPHSTAGHQTLFSPAWNLPKNDGITLKYNNDLNYLVWQNQAKLKPNFLADYPNYLSPGVSARRVFANNLERLIALKAKYDPDCRLANGPVFATSACRAKRPGNLLS